MARPLRIEFSGAIYHVTSRGNAREDICLDDTFGQQAAIEEFIKEEVIPELFPKTPSAPFALKAVDRFVQGVRVPLFVMTDFVIMVQEK